MAGEGGLIGAGWRRRGAAGAPDPRSTRASQVGASPRKPQARAGPAGVAPAAPRRRYASCGACPPSSLSWLGDNPGVAAAPDPRSTRASWVGASPRKPQARAGPAGVAAAAPRRRYASRGAYPPSSLVGSGAVATAPRPCLGSGTDGESARRWTVRTACRGRRSRRGRLSGARAQALGEGLSTYGARISAYVCRAGFAGRGTTIARPR